MRIVRQYGLTPDAWLRVEKGYRNESHAVRLQDGRLVNIIVYKSEPAIVRTIQNANAVGDFLAAKGLPARRTLDPRLIAIGTSDRRRYASLYTYLPGKTVAWEAYSQKHIKLLGKTMSDMHAVLQACDTRRLPDVTTQYQVIFERMERYFADPGVSAAMQQKLGLSAPLERIADARRLLAACRGLPSRQALHMDFVRSNILFEPALPGIRISGILDFEKAAAGHPAFDIARTLAFLLVDCKYKPAAKVRKYFLYSGYHKRGAAPLDPRLLQLVDRLVAMFLLYDFYKFLRHNPYENLPANEHFARTKDILAARRAFN